MNSVETGNASLEVQIGGEVHNSFDEQLRNNLHRFTYHETVQLVHSFAFYAPFVTALDSLEKIIEQNVNILVGSRIRDIQLQL